MTRCNKSEVIKSLKSTAYNQTGQNYFEQLSVYNSMSSHLRRVLLAKSVVDAKNKNYMRMRERQCDSTNCKSRISEQITDDMIDKLAYDTEHYPADVLRMTLNYKDPCRKYCEGDYRTICRNRSSSRRRKKYGSHPLIKDQQFPLGCNYKGKSRWEKEPTYIDCPSAISSPNDINSDNFNQIIDDPMASANSENYEDFVERYKAMISSREDLTQKDEEMKYVKFVYDITREIMQTGVYTDRELQEVFKRHLEKNKGTLNMNKMLYEIYQLKISLNILDDSDEDEEIEDLIHAQQLLKISEIRPPTPPKILDENKVVEKLLSYQKLIENQSKSSSTGQKSVVLIDANPELLVTERDVLISLMEVEIGPKQAQQICKSLFQKSKSTSLAETIQVEAEISYPSKFLLERLKMYQKSIEKNSNDDFSNRSKEDEIIQVGVKSMSKDTCIEPSCMMFSRFCQVRRGMNLADKNIQTEGVKNMISTETSAKKSKRKSEINQKTASIRNRTAGINAKNTSQVSKTPARAVSRLYQKQNQRADSTSLKDQQSKPEISHVRITKKSVPQRRSPSVTRQNITSNKNTVKPSNKSGKSLKDEEPKVVTVTEDTAESIKKTEKDDEPDVYLSETNEYDDSFVEDENVTTDEVSTVEDDKDILETETSQSED